jgi:hypothetical protein
MRITISAKATIEPAGVDIRLLDGASFNELELGPYLDEALGDLGVIGGKIVFRAIGSGVRVDAIYWAARALQSVELEALVTDTLSQWSDGAGENGLWITVAGEEVCVKPSSARDDAIAVQEEDGRAIPDPAVAIAARKGDMAALRRALQETVNPDVSVQGCTALQLAIRHGRVECALFLLANGADPNLDPGSTGAPLYRCALSHDLSDSDAVTVANALLEKGANPGARDKAGRTALDFARIRKKPALTSLLAKVTQ